MLCRYWTLLLLCCLSGTWGKKFKQGSEKKQHHPKSTTNKEDLPIWEEGSDEIKEQLRRKNLLANSNIPQVLSENACTHHHCGPGKRCRLDEMGEPHCFCVESCPSQSDPRRMVCSNHNETWESDCHLHRMRCLCMEGDYGRCLHAKHKHAHVDYFGPCKELGECTESEMADFPRRLREWLFTVMQALARQQDLPQPYLQMEEEAEHSSRRWVAAVIWKFCQLDVHPHDRWVSRHELFPLRAPLLSMEHCVAPFLDSCDVNRDHRISLVEWGSCLGLNPEEIRNRCPSSQ